MEKYKNWQIEKGDYGHYEATNLADCDAYMLFDKTLNGLKTQIDECDCDCENYAEYDDALKFCSNCGKKL